MAHSSKENLEDRLARYRQIKITVIGRNSGQTISIPVWFVLEGEALYLFQFRAPTRSGTRTFFNGPSIRIDARNAEEGFRLTP